MGKINESLSLNGKSGSVYGFDVYTYDTTFNAVRAVYAVTNRHQNNAGTMTHTLIYVGQTGDLSERFDDHHKARCFERNGANCIGVHRDNDEDSRLSKEADLLEQWSTSCND